MGRQVAALALTRISQDGRLNVRQTDQLRRALAEAGDVLLWTEMTVNSADPVAFVSDELAKITKAGVKVIEKEIEEELKEKKTEITRLEEVVAKVRKLAEAKNPKLPVDILYDHTARAAAQGLITKTETVTVTTPEEATSCGNSIEKSMNRWTNLRDQMVAGLEEKEEQLEVVRVTLADFVAEQRPMVLAVIAVLH